MRIAKLNNLGLHVIFWSLFITYEVTVAFYFTRKFAHISDYAGHYLLNIALFYCNAHLVFSRSLSREKKSYPLLILLILLEAGLYLAIKYIMVLLYGKFGVSLSHPYTGFKLFFMESLFRIIYFIGLSVAYWFGLDSIRYKTRIAQLENTRLSNELDKQALEKSLIVSENAYLKSQINPHFLFNTLSFIHNAAGRVSAALGDAVLLLSDIMRYALTQAGKDGKVGLDNEIEHIENLIALNQMRFDNKLNLNFTLNGSAEDLKIIPLVLITLVENVFKYADLADPSCPAQIELNITGGNLLFKISNKKRRSSVLSSHGIGIENVTKRMNVYYPDQYTLDISNNPHDYLLTLSIKLN